MGAKKSTAAKQRRRRLANPVATREHDRSKLRRRKIEVLSVYANGDPQCVLCSERRLGALTLDHIKGDGSAHRRSFSGINKGGLSSGRLYLWLKKNDFPAGYRVLCSNCNWKEFLRAKLVTKCSTSIDAVKSRRYCANIRVVFMALLDGKCVICGISDLDILTVHHLSGEGAAHRRAISSGLGGYKFYRAVIAAGDCSGLECRCFSCNDAAYWSSEGEDCGK